MKKAIFTVAVAALLGLSSQVSAADKGNVSQDVLAQYGLSGAKPVSDANGMNIRGKGFVAFAGFGSASISNVFIGGGATRTDATLSASGPRNNAFAIYLQNSTATNNVGLQSSATGFGVGYAR